MAPTVIMLLVCAYLTVAVVLFGGQQAESPMNLLAVVLFPVPLMLILMFEYHAVVKKSATAALLVGALFLFPLIPGGMSLAHEISRMLGSAELRPDVTQWARVGVGAASLALTTFIGVVHLRWWRRLVRWYYEHAEDEPDPVAEDTTPGVDSSDERDACPTAAEAMRKHD
jgi:hypothetical protein